MRFKSASQRKAVMAKMSKNINYQPNRLRNVKYEYGFDLTDFKHKGFQKVLKENRIRQTPNRGKNGEFIWTDSYGRIKIITANNPISGAYSRKGWRPNEKDYASYIGVTGNISRVTKVVSSIKRNTEIIKGESEGRRDFI